MKSKLLLIIIAVTLLSFPKVNFGQAPTLGTTADFVLFTTVGAVTNTGLPLTTHLTGNVGSNSGSSTFFGNVNGGMHDGDVASGQAAADLLILYGDLNTAIPTFFPGILLGNGVTLDSGVNSIPAAATLNGDLILDGQGSSTALFIFQIAGSFSTNANSKVKLINGALACNVFWKVEGAVGMASGTSMKGTVLANNAAIDMTATLDTLEGRALAINGAISVNGLLAYTPIGCGSPSLTGPIAPTLTSAACYGIFSSNGPVTNAGVTHVLGDVGTDVGLTTGFNPLFVTGMIHPIPDGSTAAASGDLLNAYNNFVALPPDIELLQPTQFGNNLVLTPHTYIMNGAVTFTDSLYLDAQNDPNAVFVIQTFGAFSTSTGSRVILINGTQSKNVYWTIDGQVDINDGSIFRGTIICNNGAMNLKTGVTLDGRALTTNGAIGTTAVDVVMPAGCTANVPPAAVNDTITMCSNGGTINIDVQINDSDYNGDSLTTTLVSNIIFGSVALNGNLIQFTSLGAFCCNTITYSICDNGIPSLCDTATVFILVVAPPVANAGVDKTICLGNSATIGSAAVVGITYSWAPALGLSSTTIAQPIANPVNTTVYTLTTSDSVTGCQNTDNVSVIVDVPVADAGPDQILCSGLSTTIGIAPVAGHTYSWSPAVGLSSSTVSNPTASPIITTTYILIVTTTLTGCTNTDTVTITVNPPPVPVAGADVAICNGDSTVIGSSPVVGETYSWSPALGLSSSTVSNPTASPTTTTTYILTATIGATGCPSSDAVTVTVNEPIANAGPDQTICPGDIIIIGVPPVAGTTYSWSPALGLSSTTISQPSANPNTTTTYFLQATTTLTGCQNWDTVTITVSPAPVAVAGPDKFYCAGDSTTIGAPPVAGDTYSWSPALGLDSVNSSQPIASPVSTTNYILTVTTTLTGCQTNDTVTVAVNPFPAALVGPDKLICSGDSTTIGAPPFVGNNYSWSPGAGLSDSTVSQPFAFPTGTTTYTLTETVGSCVNSNSVTVTVSPPPVVDAGPDQAICFGDSTAIGTPAIVGNTYTWSPALGLSSTNTAQTIAFPTITTNYIITATITATSCQASDTVTITVTQPVANAGPDQTICNGDSTLIGVPPVPGDTYSWLPVLGLDSTTSSHPFASPIVTTTYYVTVTTTATGCTNNDSVVVNVNPLPVTNAGSDVTICMGDSAVIGVPAILGDTYSWSPITGLDSTTLAQPHASPPGTTTYYLTQTITATGCQNIDSVTITVNPLPVANAGPDQAICLGDSVLIGTPGILGNTYSWSPVLDLTSPTQPQTFASPIITTTYVVTVTITATGCQNSDAMIVNLPIADAGPDQSICIGSGTTIGAPAIPGNTYSWSPALGLSSTTIAQPVASPLITTIYTLTITTLAGCQATDQVTITVNPLPVANAGADQPVCSGDSITIGTPAVSGLTYSWSPASDLSSSTAAQPMASPLSNTTYTLTVTITATGCQNTDAIIVTVNPLPVADAGPDQTIPFGSSTSIGAAAVSGSTYSWDPPTGLNSSTDAQPTATLFETTTYTLTETNTVTGCVNSNTVVITVQAALFFTGFSPNGDGVNDVWNIPILILYPENSMVIINRWGNEVWTVKNYNNTDIVFKGQNMKGDNLPDGVYWYLLEFNGQTQQGWVFIKR